MYTLYTDKIENFKCSIDVEGASLSETDVRLVLQSDKLNLLYEGTIDANGTCNIPIDKLKNILKEGTEGTMRLEVIAEDTFFSPWEDSFTVETNKKVTVEVLSSTKSPIKESAIKVKVNKVVPIVEETVEEPIIEKQPVKKQVVKEVKRLDPHSTLILRLLEKKGINQTNISENLDVANKLVTNYSKKYNINNPNQLLITVLNNVN
jgi:hypothetical protein